MATQTALVTLDTRKLHKLMGDLQKAEAAAPPGELEKVFRRWGARYRSFAQLRYTRYSRGGGDWAPLAASTVKARRPADRRRKNAKGLPKALRATILVNTGILRNVLDIQLGRPGQIETMVKMGVEVGYGGTQKHPGGKATIADIATFHQSGNSRLPQRKIIVDPDTRTMNAMVGDVVEFIKRTLN